MKKNAEPLSPNSFYHIYNRGINSEDIFKEYRNYRYFLEKYAQYIEPIAQTHAYCLLKNHFHVAIQTKTEEEIRNNLEILETKEGFAQSEAFLKKHANKSISWIISNAFSSFFKSYAQAINKANNRTGGLFEEPFLRIWIENDEYLKNLIVYIHRNPQEHGFVKDFRVYEHSSYKSFLSNAQTRLARTEVIKLFGDEEAYKKSHESELDNIDWKKIMLDF